VIGFVGSRFVNVGKDVCTGTLSRRRQENKFSCNEMQTKLDQVWGGGWRGMGGERVGIGEISVSRRQRVNEAMFARVQRVIVKEGEAKRNGGGVGLQ